MDFAGVIEEIALEGLEGITLEALWKRLENRPGFVDGPLDDDIKRYIWNLVIRHEVLQFFILPAPRPELIIFKYNEFVEKGTLKCSLPANIPEDYYSRKIVVKDGVMGCCEDFDTRVEITEQIRGPEQAGKISLQDAMEKWGQTLVIVASQKCRDMILLQNCEVFLSQELYSFLELIARSRYDGEVTYCRVKRGLCNPVTKPFSSTSNTFARLDCLVNLGLVTKQIFILTYEKPHWMNQVRIVHLKRFYKPAQANNFALLTPVADILSKAPDKTMPFYNVMKKAGLKPEVFYKTNKRFGNYLSISNRPRQIYFGKDSEADRESIKNEKSLTGHFNQLKVKLITLLKALDSSDTLEDEDEDEESILENEGDESQIRDDDTEEDPENCCPSVDDSILHQAVSIIYESGTNGVHHAQVQRRLNLSRTNMKQLSKELVSQKLVGTVKKFQGKQRAAVWMRPDLAEMQNCKASPEKKKGLSKEEKDQTDLSVGETEVPKEEPETSVSPEEEAQMTAWLEKIKVSYTFTRAENIEPTSENDDVVKAARKKFILNKLKAKRVFASMAMPHQDIVKWEREKGLKSKACRKSVRRIITSLYNQGHVDFLKVQLPDNNEEVRQMIVWPGSDLNDPFVKKAVVAYVDAALKFKENHRAHHKHLKEPSEISKQDKNFTRYNVVAELSLISVFKILTRDIKPKYTKSDGKRCHTNVSKMGRVESFHEYLHYMLHGYAGCTDGEPELKDVLEGIQQPLPVYLDVDDWRRYLPPLHLHNTTALKQINAGPGACMIGDVILNIPVGKLWNLINRPSEIREYLGKYIEDRQLQTVPLCKVPQHILIEMACRRRFMPRLLEDLGILCSLGLLSFGPRQRCNNMEFGSFYLHKKAILLDTRFSLPGRMMTKSPDGEGFPMLQYNLDTREDLIEYWKDLHFISLNTRLGLRNKVDVPGDHGDINVIAATKPTSFVEIMKRTECDWLPGDRRGVAGLDSSLMTHLTRNWRHTVPQLQCSQRLKNMSSPDTESQGKSEEKKRKASTVGSERPVKKRKVIIETKSKRGPRKQMKKKVIKVRVPKPKKYIDGHAKYLSTFDAKDYMAIGRMRRTRSYFSPMENGMLLLCQLANHMLNPKYSCVQASVIRDIMHENLPESIDKTTQAIKGKVCRLNYDPSFRLHMAVYLTQAKSNKALVAKYCNRSLTQNSPQAVQLFRQLVMDLKENFRHACGISLPESMAQLLQDYTVSNTMNMFDGLKGWSHPMDSVSDIRTMVCGDLVEMFLHLQSPLSPVPVYYTFSKFEESELKKAYLNLKSRDILVQLKSTDKDQKRMITNPSVMNNHRCKKIHQEVLRSLLPKDIFRNISEVMQQLQELPGSLLRSATSLPTTSVSTTSVSQAQSSLSSPDVTGNVEEESSSGGDDPCSSNSGKRENSDPNFVQLDIEEFQGAVSLVTICLAALDELSMDIELPDESVSLDRTGVRKLGLDMPKTLKKRPLTMERGPDGKRIRKPSEKKQRLDSEDEDQQGETTTVRGVSRKFATIDCPLTENAKISLHQQQRFLARQQQASSKPQDRSMEEKGEEGNNEPGPSGKIDSPPLEQSSSAMDYEEEVSSELSTSGNTSSVQLSAASSSHTTVSGRSIRSQQSANSTRNEAGQNIVSLPSMQIKYSVTHINNISQDGASYLPNFVAWVASSCLMTLARTSYIHRLNLMVADCSLSRHFALVPIKMGFRLKRDRGSSGTDKRALTPSSIESKKGNSTKSENGHFTKSKNENTSELENVCSAESKNENTSELENVCSAESKNEKPTESKNENSDEDAATGNDNIRLSPVINMDVDIASTLGQRETASKLQTIESGKQNPKIAEENTQGLVTCDSSTPKQDQAAPKTQIIESGEVHSTVATENPQGSLTCDTSKSSQKDITPETDSETSQRHKTYLPNVCGLDQYRDLLKRLEMVFLPTELENDLSETELVPLLPPALVDVGLRLYALLDAAGEFGLDERDVQTQLSLSWTNLQEIETSLVRGKAVLRAGFTWRRLVSRRHFRPWLVEVPASDPSKTAQSSCGEASESENNVTSLSTTTLNIGKTVLYHVRPWRHYHGGLLDTRGLRRVLERVLTDVMVRPGQTVSALCRQLNPHMLPATTLDAIEILEELGCVRSVFVSTSPKVDMFASLTRNARVSSPEEPAKDCVRALNVSVEAPLVFASFMQAAELYCQGR